MTINGLYPVEDGINKAKVFKAIPIAKVGIVNGNNTVYSHRAFEGKTFAECFGEALSSNNIPEKVVDLKKVDSDKVGVLSKNFNYNAGVLYADIIIKKDDLLEKEDRFRTRIRGYAPRMHMEDYASVIDSFHFLAIDICPDHPTVVDCII